MNCRLKDIAEELNLSINTVSSALKDRGRIKKETVTLVKKTAHDMGYIPNSNAQSLRTNCTKTISVVYDQFINPYYSIVTDLLNKKFNKHGYNLIIYSDIDSGSKLTAKIAMKILARKVDGIISFLEIDDNAIGIIKNSNTPLLVLGRDMKDVGVDCIYSDDETGGYIATKYLLEQGHRKIMLVGFAENLSCGILRINGHKRALNEFGIKYDEKMCVPNLNQGNGIGLMEYVSKNNIDYTALFCFNDILAFDCIYRLEQAGVNVPKDVSVVGYDNIQSHLLIPCQLTTIDADKEQLADIGSEVMLLKINDSNYTNRNFSKINNVKLIKRNSTALVE